MRTYTNLGSSQSAIHSQTCKRLTCRIQERVLERVIEGVDLRGLSGGGGGGCGTLLGGSHARRRGRRPQQLARLQHYRAAGHFVLEVDVEVVVGAW